MTLAEFNATVSDQVQPPAGLSPALQALWWDAKGDWDRAHTIAQDIQSAEGSWIHAYLHRVEGDDANAAYWYARAAKSVERGPLPAERDNIIAAMLAAQ